MKYEENTAALLSFPQLRGPTLIVLHETPFPDASIIAFLALSS